MALGVEVAGGDEGEGLAGGGEVLAEEGEDAGELYEAGGGVLFGEAVEPAALGLVVLDGASCAHASVAMLGGSGVEAGVAWEDARGEQAYVGRFVEGEPLAAV